ncbi:hypothetical protein OROGR_018506 [Orobanche gracilis]
MPRTSSSSRKGTSNTTASANSTPVDLLRAASEGIESICSDLMVDHTDVRLLMLAWKMQAEKQGYFTLVEWRTALKALRADTIVKLKKTLVELEKRITISSSSGCAYS